MKKKIIAIFVFCVLFCSGISLFSENNTVTIISGIENHKAIMKAKNVYVYVTFDNTFLWKDGQTVDDFLAARKSTNEKKNKVDKDKMIKTFYKKLEGNLKLGFKWKLKRIDNPEQISSGYIIYFNYDKCIPITGFGAKGYGTITVYKAGELTTPLLVGTVESFSMAVSFSDFDPKYQFSEIGQRFAKEIVKFLQNIDVIK